MSNSHEQTEDIRERAVLLGEYITEHRATVRAAAKHFGISKSTVHKDITEKLPVVCPPLFPAVKDVLETNKRNAISAEGSPPSINTRKRRCRGKISPENKNFCDIPQKVLLFSE